MTIITPDISTRLKPEFMAVVGTIYREFCNLQPDMRVLIVGDARTPSHILSTFHGMALSMGADAIVVETQMPRGGPTYQPDVKWSPMLVAATRESDLIVDLGIGYSHFLLEALDRGARVIMPSDGIGNPYMDDMLIRTIHEVDIHAVRRLADRIAAKFTSASTCTLRTGVDDELVIDISGLQGIAADGFLWDKDKGTFKSSYAILPPAQPGIMLPRGRANGTVSVDGTLLWHPTYQEEPRTPLKLRFEDSRLVEIGGDPYLGNRITNWLNELNDPGAWEGPNHLNIGINPNAVYTQNQEWERVLGTVTCGMGDMPAGLMATDGKVLDYPKSRVHWDWTMSQPTILLDGETILGKNKVNVSADLPRDPSSGND